MVLNSIINYFKAKHEEHYHHKSSSHLSKRLTALIISVFISLAAGTPYLYGVYSPQLIKRCGLTTSDSATISLATNLGSGLGGLPGGILIDHFGPQFAILTGSICIFIGYFAMYEIYEHKINNLLFICISMIFVGFGSITSYFATLKASQANFIKHKSAAGSLPVSAYGSGATVFSIISATFFNNKTGELFKFLSLFCGSIAFIGSFFIHIYVNEDDEEIQKQQEDLERFHALPQNEHIVDSGSSSQGLTTPEDESLLNDIEAPEQSLTREDSLKGSISYWGIGNRTPSSSISLQENEARNIIENLRKNKDKVKDELKTPYQTLKERLTHKIFLIHYFVVSMAAGIGQMYIFCVGFIVIAQFYYKKHNDDDSDSEDEKDHIALSLRLITALTRDPEASSLQALQVSIISIASFIGRLLSGFLSDFIHKKWHIQRLWIVQFTIALLCLGQYLTMINVSSFHGTSINSAIMGGSYGLIFGTYPAVIADQFGTKTFSTNWGLICTGPLLILYLLNKYFGWIYDLNTDKDTGICYLGNGCYMGAFEASLILCIVAFFVTGILIYVSRKK
ncbi:uncharacterized protein KGF55_000948 [Candida pseudojiufengensis]|uniref:uncharacterized protein n=1 Tax=Candida pseudojiufengensis TaxID=497109 RepID=UPI0022257A58|nr:uncharacterized protein KGF55_000948 [Candida pseudojiufengensis]KAI5965586.1 hypothetical protein KGF55_000948 [Candida pseudojiufengensis]